MEAKLTCFRQRILFFLFPFLVGPYMTQNKQRGSRKRHVNHLNRAVKPENIQTRKTRLTVDRLFAVSVSFRMDVQPPTI